MSNQRPPSGEARRGRRPILAPKFLDILTVFLLSIVAVLTAWCGFEASKWGGEMSIAFSEASSSRIQAAAAEAEASAARQYDLTIYAEWVRAVADGREGLADYVEERFSPELRTAFETWDAQGRENRGPFVMVEYAPPGAEEAAALDLRADQRFAQALAHNQRGDDYSLLTVLFALVLFLTAMSQRELVGWMRRVLLSLAIVVAVIGSVVMFTFPIKI